MMGGFVAGGRPMPSRSAVLLARTARWAVRLVRNSLGGHRPTSLREASRVENLRYRRLGEGFDPQGLPQVVILSGARSAKSKDPVRRQPKTFGKEPMPA